MYVNKKPIVCWSLKRTVAQKMIVLMSAADLSKNIRMVLNFENGGIVKIY